MAERVFEIEEFEINNRSPFRLWFDSRHATTAAKITIALMRLQAGYHSNVKSIGSGVAEYHGYEPQSKLRYIKPSASRDCSTYQFRCASLSELEFQQ
jgi:hypothetical protein